MSEDLSEILMHTQQSVRDMPDPRDHVPVMSSQAAMTPIPALLDLEGLRPYSPDQSDQGRRGSCTFHAGANGADMYMNRLLGKNRRSRREFSAEGGYNAVRASLGKLSEDKGLTIRQMANGLNQQGLVHLEFWDPRHTHIAPPSNYDEISIKFKGGFYSIPQITDEGGRFARGTDYSLRLWLQWVKLEKLPIWVFTKIPDGDMRSSAVRRTGVRSITPYRSISDPGYWHAEVVEDIVWMDGRIYVVVLGSWGLVGDNGRFYIPWVNFLTTLYSGQAFAPKKEWA